jgi:hypothetical protein
MWYEIKILPDKLISILETRIYYDGGYAYNYDQILKEYVAGWLYLINLIFIAQGQLLHIFTFHELFPAPNSIFILIQKVFP